jgi:hypothetical protein
MSLAAKHTALCLVTLYVAVVSSWLGSALYSGSGWLLPALLLIIGFVVQVMVIAFVRSLDEQELELLRELRMAKGRAILDNVERMNEKIEELIHEGDLKNARAWMKERDKLL